MVGCNIIPFLINTIDDRELLAHYIYADLFHLIVVYYLIQAYNFRLQ